MQRINVVYFLAGLLVAGSISLAVAEPFGGDDAAAGGMMPPDAPMMGGFHRHGMMGRGGEWRHDPAHAVIMDMRGIERLDRMSGHSQDLTALYQHVLEKTQNPEVRHYTYMQMARSEMKPANVEQVVATLRKSLDEDLTHLDAVKKD